MSFGTCNSGLVFQGVVERVFESMVWKELVVCMDDIVVFAKIFEVEVFNRMREAQKQ